MAGNDIDSGVDYELFYVEETTFGVTDDSSSFVKVGIVTGSSVSVNNEIIKHKGIGTNAVIASSHSKQDASVSISMESTDAVALFIKTLHDNPAKSYTVLLKASGNSTRYAFVLGGRLASFSFSVAEGEPITAEMEIQAKLFDVVNADPFTTPTYNSWTAGAPFIWSDTSVTKDASWAASGAINEVKGFSFEASWEVMKSWHLNQGKYPARVQSTGYEASGSITLDLEDTEQYDAIVDQEGGVLTIPISTTYTATLTGVKFESGELPVEEYALVEYEIGFQVDSIAIA